MTFDPGDRLKLHTILDLSRDQLKDGAQLDSAMRSLERFDADNGTALVAAVQAAATDYENLTADIAAELVNDGLKVVDIRGEIRTESFGVGNATAALRSQRRGKLKLIKKYLDPHQTLEPFVLTGRVLRTL